MLDVIYAPVQAIHNAHKGRLLKPTIYLAIIAVINFLSGLLLTGKFVSVGQAFALAALLFLATFVLPWVIAAVLMVVLNIMDTDTIGYYEGFVCVVYGEIPKSFGLFLASLFLFIPTIGPVLAGLALACAGVLHISILIRAIKELFGTDIIHALVGLAIVIGFFATIGMLIASSTYMQAAFVLIASQL